MEARCLYVFVSYIHPWTSSLLLWVYCIQSLGLLQKGSCFLYLHFDSAECLKKKWHVAMCYTMNRLVSHICTHLLIREIKEKGKTALQQPAGKRRDSIKRFSYLFSTFYQYQWKLIFSLLRSSNILSISMDETVFSFQCYHQFQIFKTTKKQKETAICFFFWNSTFRKHLEMITQQEKDMVNVCL